MAASYDDAAAALFQAPHGDFVNERKRLAGELKAAGDKAGATRLGKINRPPISVWAVNQLWWQSRDEFEPIFESAARVRDGDLTATAAHREGIAKLRGKAALVLAGGGHAATEGTLRRVTQTLQALAANGGFDPDPPGMLVEDRDPPGFEALGISPGATPSAPPPRAAPKPAPVPREDEAADDGADEEAAAAAAAAADKRRRDAEEARAKAEAAAEKRRAEEAEQRRVAERNRIEAAIRTGVGEIEARVREVDRLRKALDAAEHSVAQARAVVEDLEARLEQLDG